MRHVANKHQDHPDPLFPECAHEDDIEPRKWIKLVFDYLRVKLLVYVITWGRGQLRINFTSIFKVFTKLPESRTIGKTLKIQV